MRFLLDANFSPALVDPLRQAGHPAVHVVDLGLLTATDTVILRRAADEGYTADSDFPTCAHCMAPPVLHLRHINELSWQAQAALLVANLPTVLDDLENGAIVSLSRPRWRSADCRSRESLTRQRRQDHFVSSDTEPHTRRLTTHRR